MIGFLLTSVAGLTLSPFAMAGVELGWRAVWRGIKRSAVLDHEREQARVQDRGKQFTEPEK